MKPSHNKGAQLVINSDQQYSCWTHMMFNYCLANFLSKVYSHQTIFFRKRDLQECLQPKSVKNFDRYESGTDSHGKKKFKVRGILLDLDGTIVDSREAYLKAGKTAFKKIGKRTFDAETSLEIPKKLEQNLPIEEVLKGGDMQKFLKSYLNTYYLITIEKTRPFPKISETLKKLSKKAKLALVTMRYVSKQSVVKEMEKFGLAEYFQCIITALATCNSKPSPEALLECARQLGMKIGECVVLAILLQT